MRPLIYGIFLVFCSFAKSQNTPLVYLDANQTLVYSKYANQGESDTIHQVPDFSWAGYQMGGVKLPTVATRITLNPLKGDNRIQIQQAIDQIASLPLDIHGFRGAILLKAGQYPCSGPLYIRHSGIILRGEGQDDAEHGGTELIATANEQHNLIQCIGNLSYNKQNNKALDTILIPKKYTDEKGNVIDGKFWVNASVTSAAKTATETGILALQITTSINDYASYHSKEGSNAPYLSLNYRAPNATMDSTLILAPTDDAFVRGGAYTHQNYGSDDELVVKYNGDGDDVTRESYLKFSVPTNINISQAKLHLWCHNAGNTHDMPHYVFEINNTDWDESILTYGNKPNFEIKNDKVLNAKIAVGSRKVRVENSENYKMGQAVTLKRTPNQEWIDALGMTPYGWTPTAYRVDYPNKIEHITGDTLTLQIPLVQCIDKNYGGAEILPLSPSGMLEQVGIEHLLIRSHYNNDEDEAHGWSAIQLSDCQNCWVKNVTAQYFGYACVHIKNASACTIQDCAMLDPKSITTGGRKYSFAIDNGSFNLFQRCYTRGGRHDFVTGSQVAGPNVFLDGLAENTQNDIGPHHRYATGILFDNIVGGLIRVQNRKESGTGHGWAGAQTMFWHLTSLDASIKVESPLGARNWAIDCNTKIKEGDGYWENNTEYSGPRSLYLQQLKERLGNNALDNISIPAQKNGNIHHQLAQWQGFAHRLELNNPSYLQHRIPGTIECEHFDYGNNGEAYIDYSSGNKGLSKRFSDVDIYTQPARLEGILKELSYIGDTQKGEMLNYTIPLNKGTYKIQIQYACDTTDQTLEISIDGQTKTVSLSPTTSLLDFEKTPSTDFSINQTGNYTLKIQILGEHIHLDQFSLEMINTNLKTKTNNSDIILYPNPSTGTFYIKNNVNCTIKVTDCYGRQLIINPQKTQKQTSYSLPSNFTGIAHVYGTSKQEQWTKQLIVKP